MDRQDRPGIDAPAKQHEQLREAVIGLHPVGHGDIDIVGMERADTIYRQVLGHVERAAADVIVTDRLGTDADDERRKPAAEEAVEMERRALHHELGIESANFIAKTQASREDIGTAYRIGSHK